MYSLDKSHAPRERVSWNCQRNLQFHQRPVTLHVSVWVEMILITALGLFFCGHAPRERVSWNRESTQRIFTRMSRSTWACELKFKDLSIWVNALMTSRSTWACELKSFYSDRETKITRHAPRERVSWNVILSLLTKNFWKVTLHVSVWVEIWIFLRWNQFIASRSTWACELKYKVHSQTNERKKSRSTWACELK